MLIELTKDEAEFVLSAVDQHVRANGLNAARRGLDVFQKIQDAAQNGVVAVPTEADPQSTTEES